MFDRFAVLHAFVQEFHSILHENCNKLCQMIIKNVKLNKDEQKEGAEIPRAGSSPLIFSSLNS